MTALSYLETVLIDQRLPEDSDELKVLRTRKGEVTDLLLEAFPTASPTIRYGGSMAKKTMIRAAYDLDVICCFPHDSNAAGDTLSDIYNNSRKALEPKYFVESKPSALRLKGLGTDLKVDFHVDVVPGRYFDETKTDAWLHQTTGDKSRLKTNLQLQIDHVRDSGVRDAIRLLKLWRFRNGLQIRHFVLDLLVIKLLSERKKETVDKQLPYVWSTFQDDANNLSVQDPANPNGNDLSPLLNDGVKAQLSAVAKSTLLQIENLGWEAVFGKVESDDTNGNLSSLQRAAVVITRPSKPWLDLR